MTSQELTTALQSIKRRKKFSRSLTTFADVTAEWERLLGTSSVWTLFGSTIDLRLIAREGD